MQHHTEFDQSRLERFLEANKNKDYELTKYLHQDFVYTFNKHVFNRRSYLWLLKVTYPLIDFELEIKDLIIIQNNITCKLVTEVSVLQNGSHLLVGKLLKNQYWKGCIRAHYKIKQGQILTINLEAEHLQPVSLSY